VGLSVFQVFLQVFSMHVLSIFICLQKCVATVILDVFKVDQVLHLSPRLLLSRLGVSSSQRQLSIQYDTAAGAAGPSELEAQALFSLQ
jgi:hypothetical protein